MGFFNKIIMKKYFTGVIKEFKNIRWLSFRSAIVLAVVCLIIAVIVGLFLGFLDSQTTVILNEIVN